MLFKRNKQLNGHGTDPTALQGALEKLRQDIHAIVQGLSLKRESRRQALLDEEFDLADKLEAEIKLAETQLESYRLQEPLLRVQLEAAQVKARKDAEPTLVAKYLSKFKLYGEKLNELADISRQVDELRAEARLTVGDARASILLPVFEYAGIVRADHIEMWMKRNAREFLLPGELQSQPQSPRVAVKPAPKPKPGEKPAGAVSPAPLRAPNDTEPLEPGQVRAMVLMPGFSPADNRPAAHAGQILRMPASAAKLAAERGAIQIMEGKLT